MKVAVSFIKSLYDEKKTIKLIDMTSADYIHVDIMDGEFVSTKNYDFDDVFNQILNIIETRDFDLRRINVKMLLLSILSNKQKYSNT